MNKIIYVPVTEEFAGATMTLPPFTAEDGAMMHEFDATLAVARKVNLPDLDPIGVAIIDRSKVNHEHF